MAALQRQCLPCPLRAIEGIVKGGLSLGIDIFSSCCVEVFPQTERTPDRSYAIRAGRQGLPCWSSAFVAQSERHPWTPLWDPRTKSRQMWKMGTTLISYGVGTVLAQLTS